MDLTSGPHCILELIKSCPIIAWLEEWEREGSGATTALAGWLYRVVIIAALDPAPESDFLPFWEPNPLWSEKISFSRYDSGSEDQDSAKKWNHSTSSG